MLYFFSTHVGLFAHSLYTASVLVAGMLLFPAVLAVSGNLLFVGYVMGTVVLYYTLVRPDEQARSQFVAEHVRDLVINESAKQARLQTKAEEAGLKQDLVTADRRAAQDVFDALDDNQNGYLEEKEMKRLLAEWRVAFVTRLKKFRPALFLSS